MRLIKRPNNQMLQIMDLVTEIPHMIAKTTSDATLPPIVYANEDENQAGTKRPHDQGE